LISITTPILLKASTASQDNGDDPEPQHDEEELRKRSFAELEKHALEDAENITNFVQCLMPKLLPSNASAAETRYSHFELEELLRILPESALTCR
jgi:hypothetical protein